MTPLRDRAPLRTRRRILFFAEGVALAHVARPMMLADLAHRAGHDVTFAVDPRHDWVVRDKPYPVLPLSSLNPSAFLRNVARGAPIFDARLLERYVGADRDLIGRSRPDVIVGDLRLSLSVSARLAKVPYASIANAYWSPYWAEPEYRMPPMATTRWLPAPMADALFHAARPAAFAWHAVPLNRVRRRHDLPPIPYDVRHVYTDADAVMYADLPELFPARALPASHVFIGPMAWSPPMTLPQWWEQVDRSRPVVYVTLGSTGDARWLPAIVKTLSALPVTVLVAAVDAHVADALPPNVHVARYLPGDRATDGAALVICNGGASTGQQALAAGVPVLALASNLDQILHMQPVVRAGAGLLLRADRTDARAIDRAIRALLGVPSFGDAARGLARLYARHDPGARFADVLARLAP